MMTAILPKIAAGHQSAVGIPADSTGVGTGFLPQAVLLQKTADPSQADQAAANGFQVRSQTQVFD
jgi:hypothetical protein